MAATRPEPVSKSEKAVQQTTEGVFLGIEQGDYAHWKMRTKSGEEISYFILQPDASVEKVINKAGSYVGRTCLVQWKSSIENIPEAGGKITVEQIISVEWLKK